jgi:hypothetical protein
MKDIYKGINTISLRFPGTLIFGTTRTEARRMWDAWESMLSPEHRGGRTSTEIREIGHPKEGKEVGSELADRETDCMLETISRPG